jgi:tetratricopeptide (TPR) repeat protein
MKVAGTQSQPEDQGNANVSPSAATAWTPPAGQEQTCLGPQAACPWDRRDLWICVVLGVAALGVRLAYLWQSRSGPTFYLPVVDADTYHQMAMRLARAEGMAGSFFWQPFLYPYLLGQFYKVTSLLGGPSIVAAKLVQALLGAATCVLVYRLGRTLLGRPAGLTAGAITALYGPLIFYESEMLGAGLAAFWSVALVWLLLRAARWGQWRDFAWAGAAAAMAVLTRPTFLPLVIVAAAWLLWTTRERWRPVRRLLAPAAAGLAAWALPLMLVGLAGKVTVGRFACLPASGGINLYIGNNPQMERTLLIRPGWDWENLTNMPRQEGLKLTDEEGFFRKKVIDYVRTQPGSFLAGLAKKTARYACPRELPRNEDPYMFRRWSPLLAGLMWKAGGFGFPFGLVFPLAVVGLVVAARRLPAIVWLMPVLHAAALVLVFVTARYRVEAAPLLALLAAAGAWGLVDWVRKGRYLAASACVLLAGALAVGGSLAGPFAEEKVNYEAELAYDLGTIHFRSGHYEPAARMYQEAIRLRPDYGDAYNELGNTRAGQQRLAEATECYRKAIQLSPHNAKAYHNLATMYLAKGDLDEAIGLYEHSLKLNVASPQTWGKLAEAMGKKGRWKEAAQHYQRAADLATERGLRLQMRFKQALAQWRLGDPQAALATLKDLHQQAPKHPRVLAALAWLKATCPDPAVRSGQEALELARQSLEFGGRSIAAFEAQAAAQAELGQYAQAARSAENALLLTLGRAQGQQMAQAIRRRVELYRGGRPYRAMEPPLDIDSPEPASNSAALALPP